MCCKQLPAKSNQDEIKCIEEETKYIEQDTEDLKSENPMELGLFTIKAVTNQTNGQIFVTPEVNVTQFYKNVDVCTFFKFHFIRFSLSIKTDEWTGQVTAL